MAAKNLARIGKRLPPRGGASTAKKPLRDFVNDPTGQAPTSNTAAVCTLTGAASMSWIVRAIRYSYTAAPTGGSLTVAWADGGTNYSEILYISAGGPNSIPMNDRRFPQGATVTITLAAGGSGISGSVYADAGKGY